MTSLQQKLEIQFRRSEMKKAVQKNIFEEINRTIELKNKLTVAKNNINKAIVRGGANNPKH